MSVPPNEETDDLLNQSEPDLLDQSEPVAPGKRIIELIVPLGERPERIDQYLARMIAHTSRSKVQEAIAAQAVFVNDAQLDRSSYKIKGGDRIRVHVPGSRRSRAEAEDIPLSIVYEDDAILVIDKPAGMVVHPAFGSTSGTLVNALLHHIKEFRKDHPAADPDRPGIVHRLDKDTSGLMVVAKNEEAHRLLARQFFNHTASRVYLAIVWGNLKSNFGRIDTLIGRHPKDRKLFAVLPENGKQAITEYYVLESFTGFTLVELRLKTGRTHQIRVHMQHLGHPVFGDVTYGGRVLNVVRHDVPKFKAWSENLLHLIHRQALHARALRLFHPSTGELMEWTSPIPADIESVLAEMRRMRDQLYGARDDK